MMLTMKNAIMEEDEENKKDGSPAHSPIPKNYREFKVFTSIEPKSRKFQLKKELNQLAKNKIQQIHELNQIKKVTIKQYQIKKLVIW